VLSKKLRVVLGLTILVTKTSGSVSIGLPYTNSNWLGHFELILLSSSCPKFCLVFQIPRLSPQPISTAWAPKAIPLYKYLTYLASFLPTSIPAWAYRLLSLVTYTYTFTSHFSYHLVTTTNVLDEAILAWVSQIPAAIMHYIYLRFIQFLYFKNTEFCKIYIFFVDPFCKRS
jgi:hypothetical protein